MILQGCSIQFDGWLEYRGHLLTEEHREVIYSSFLAPAVTVGETEGAMNSACVFFFTSSFAYNFVRKKARITIFGMWVTSRWIMDNLKYFKSEFNTQGRRGENNDVTALGRL